MHTTQHQNTMNSIIKINTGYEYISFSKKTYNGQQVYATMFSITDYHENANKKNTRGYIFKTFKWLSS